MNRIVPLLLLLTCLSCERDHASTATVKQFTDALLYGDHDRLFDAHVDSTEQGEFCRKTFRDLLEKAQRKVTSEDCQRVRSLSDTDLEEMADELRLAVQVTGWSCKNQEGTCVDYARAVFEQAIDEHPLVTSKPKKIEVRRLFGDESTAAAYLDITMSDGSIDHRTLELKNVGVGWRVSGGFLTE